MSINQTSNRANFKEVLDLNSIISQAEDASPIGNVEKIELLIEKLKSSMIENGIPIDDSGENSLDECNKALKKLRKEKIVATVMSRPYVPPEKTFIEKASTAFTDVSNATYNVFDNFMKQAWAEDWERRWEIYCEEDRKEREKVWSKAVYMH